MSHLPPKPDFDHAPPRHYARPGPMGIPDRLPYPPHRDRDIYPPPPRSPPRSKHTPSRSGDSYIAPRDSYVSRDAYPSSYDRREDDRYREREWERRDREYLPSEYRHRNREPGRDERAEWARERDREADRPRRWEEDGRRAYDRERDRRERSPLPRDRAWTRRREDDRRVPRESERVHDAALDRTWHTRGSPPRQMASSSHQPSRADSSGPSRARSPPHPSAYHRDHAAEYPRPPSPLYEHSGRRRSQSPDRARARNHSKSPTRPRPSAAAETERPGRSPRRDSSSSRSHTRSDTHSRSPARRKRNGIPSRLPRPAQDEEDAGYSREMPPDNDIKPPPREPSPMTVPSAQPENRSPPRVKEELIEETPPSIKVEPATELKVDQESTKDTKPEVKVDTTSNDQVSLHPAQTHSQNEAQLPRRRRSRSPPTAPRNYVKTPTTPMSPHLSQTNLLVKPEWQHRAGNATRPVQTSAAPAPEDHPTPMHFPIIPEYEPKPSASAAIEIEIARLRAHRAHLVSEHASTYKAARRALHELDMASIDLKFAETRRKIADAQLEKARFGMLGIDYAPAQPDVRD